MREAKLRGAVSANSRFGNFRILGCFLIVFMACYAPALITDYAFVGGYQFIDPDRQELRIQQTISEGRPIHALSVLFYSKAGITISDLKYIRFLAVVGVCLLGWTVFTALIREGCGRFQSFCVSATLCCTLPFQVYVAWGGTTFLYPYAAMFSGYAFLLGNQAFETDRRSLKWILAAGSILMILVALTIYQPAAMFFWVFAAIILLKRKLSLTDMFYRISWYCLIVFFAMLSGYVVYKVCVSLFPHLSPRGGLVQNIFEKIVWFISEPLVNALNFTSLSPSHWLSSDKTTILTSFHKDMDAVVAWSIALMIAGGLLRYLQGSTKERLAKLSIVISLLFLSYMPNLVIESGYAAYRTLSSLTSVVVVCSYFAFLGYIDQFRSRLSHAFGNYAVGIFAIISASLAAYHVHTYFAMPSSRELAVMRSQLERLDLSSAQTIYAIQPPARNTLAPIARYDEFGLPSSMPGPRIIPSMVRLVLRQSTGEDTDLPNVVVADVFDPFNPPPDSVVLDMRNLRKAHDLLASDLHLALRDTMPLVRSQFDIYIKENELWYVKDPCVPSDTREFFFLHLIPIDVSDLPEHRQIHGFDNLDFDFVSHGVIFDEICIAKLSLPDYPISRINTGQYIRSGERIWSEKIPVPRYDRRSN